MQIVNCAVPLDKLLECMNIVGDSNAAWMAKGSTGYFAPQISSPKKAASSGEILSLMCIAVERASVEDAKRRMAECFRRIECTTSTFNSRIRGIKSVIGGVVTSQPRGLDCGHDMRTLLCLRELRRASDEPAVDDTLIVLRHFCDSEPLRLMISVL